MSYDIDEVLSKLDVCYLLRVQTERQRLEYFPSRARVRAAVRAEPIARWACCPRGR